MSGTEVAVEPHKGTVKAPDGATPWVTPSRIVDIGRFINLLVNMHDMELMLKLKLFEPRKGKRILIEETIRQFKDCVNDWIQALHQLGEKPTRTAVHRFAYKKLRRKYPQLHTDVLQEAMDLAIETYRAWLNNPNKGKEIPRFDKDCIYFEGRCVKFDRHFISLPLAGKRVWLPMHIPAKFKQYLQHKHGRVILKKVKDEYYVYVSVNVPEPEPYEPRGWFGVDIGIRHIIVVSDAKGKVNWFLNGAIGWKKNMECRISGLQRLKDKGVKKGVWRVLKRLSGKVKSRQSYINHCIAKQLVLMAKMWGYGIAIENLKGLRRGKVGKRHRKRLHKWAYRDLINKIVYKAKLHGVPVVFVNPKGTSRTCSKCSAKGVVKGRIFVCKKCGLKLDRDLNASRNIALRAPPRFEKRGFRTEVVL